MTSEAKLGSRWDWQDSIWIRPQLLLPGPGSAPSLSFLEPGGPLLEAGRPLWGPGGAEELPVSCCLGREQGPSPSVWTAWPWPAGCAPGPPASSSLSPHTTLSLSDPNHTECTRCIPRCIRGSHLAVVRDGAGEGLHRGSAHTSGSHLQPVPRAWSEASFQGFLWAPPPALLPAARFPFFLGNGTEPQDCVFIYVGMLPPPGVRAVSTGCTNRKRGERGGSALQRNSCSSAAVRLKGLISQALNCSLI